LFTDDVMEKKCLQKSKSKKVKKEQWKKILENYILKKQYGNHMVKIQYVWFFFCVNDNKYVDLKCFQTIKTYSLL
jgi:hypothetical protein